MDITPVVGTRRYILGEQLGTGAMGAVTSSLCQYAESHTIIGRVADFTGEYAAARASFDAALATHRALGDQIGVTRALRGLGSVALSYFAESIALFRRLGERYAVGVGLYNRYLGTHFAAQAMYSSASEARRSPPPISGVIRTSRAVSPSRLTA
jgi:hypothetical protein